MKEQEMRLGKDWEKIRIVSCWGMEPMKEFELRRSITRNPCTKLFQAIYLDDGSTLNFSKSLPPPPHREFPQDLRQGNVVSFLPL